jgi:glycosyltransferase involved in cell wall biosynthesis
VTTSRRRVVHILAGLYPSGMERMLVSAAPYWQEAGWQVEIIGQGNDHPFASDLMSAGYHLSYVRSLRTAAGLGDLARLLRVTKPDVIHMHTEQAHGPISLVARVTSPRAGLVQTVHNIFNFRGVTVPRRRLQHSVARLVGTKFVAPSSEVADNELKNWGLTCQVIENWVADEFARAAHIDKRSTIAESPLRIAMVGNCSEVKNHEIVLRAALAVPRVVVVHVGRNSAATDEERDLARQLEGKRQLHMLGGRTDVTAILQSVQAFAMPSLVEGMGVALAEALCMGLPCIISDAPGLQWAASEPGVLVARDVDSWTKLLTRLSRDNAFMSFIASVAQSGIDRQGRRFSARRGVMEYAGVYAEVSRGRQ